MNIKEIASSISENKYIIIVIIIILIPPICKITSLYYKSIIDNLREQNNLLKETNSFLEKKLKDSAPKALSNDGFKDGPMGGFKDGPSLNDSSESIEQSRIRMSLKYPAINNPKKPSKDDIRKLADFYDLNKDWKINGHLKIQEGDISYWCEQGLSEEEIKLEFESRRIALERAEKNHQVIETQGDLSYLAEKIQAQLKISGLDNQ